VSLLVNYNGQIVLTSNVSFVHVKACSYTPDSCCYGYEYTVGGFKFKCYCKRITVRHYLCLNTSIKSLSWTIESTLFQM